MDNSTQNFSLFKTSAEFTSFYIELWTILQSFLLNISMIWLITRTRIGVASEFIHLNLSVCEIGVCLNNFLYILCIDCELVFFTLQGLALTGRSLFQSLICLERYLAVVRPITFLKFKPLRYRMICCTVAWILVLVSCLCCGLIMRNLYGFVCIYLIQCILFFSIQLFCLVAVLSALMQSGPGERKREKEENHMKKRAFQIILITTISIMACDMYNLVTLVGILTDENNPPLWLFSLVCYALACLVHPFLYLHRTVKLSHLCHS